MGRQSGKDDKAEIMDKMRVVWLCHFSNPEVYSRLDLHQGWLLRILKRMACRSVSTEIPDFANWITNGIKEFENFNDVELHIVSPYPILRRETQEFTLKGIHYHFFKNEDDDAFGLIYRHVFKPRFWKYRKNRRRVSFLINKIQPDIVHLIGAENPFYSLALLDVPKDVVTIAQLQTLLLDPDVKNNNPHFKMYEYRTSVERKILKFADFIGTAASKFWPIVWREIGQDVTILNTTLPLKDPIILSEEEKTYDFVYFASSLSKAADLALEAFGIALKRHDNITLDVIGGFNVATKQLLDAIIKKYDMADFVHFEGRLLTHDDVLQQIRKSRFALLPLRSDLISGTIREAMSNGLPVLTTDTGELGTQRLNERSQCALISKIGDHQALADNIIQLLSDDDLAESLRQNAYQLRTGDKDNIEVARGYVDAYKACLNYKIHGTPIPEELTRI